MTRPLTRVESSVRGQAAWLKEEERRSVEKRGELGRMEFWLRLTRSRITKEIRAGRDDAIAGFTSVCRVFKLALELRARGDARLWNHLMQYAQQVLEPPDPHH